MFRFFVISVLKGNVTMRKLNRRQFNQLLIAGTTLAAVGIPVERALAQGRPVLRGLRMRPMTLNDDDDEEMVSQTINPENGDINQRTQLKNQEGALAILRRNERLSGLASLAKGSLLIAATQGLPGDPEVVSRLMISNGSARNITMRGLGPNNTVESLLAKNDGSILSIVSLNSGIPPLRLATIDAQTGQASLIEGFNFPPNTRFSNLTQCPNGTIYGTALGQEGSVRLVQLDVQKQQIMDLPLLRFEQRTLSNDVKSLTCSGTGQLFALADPIKRDSNVLFTVDVGTGAMKLVREVDTEKVTFSHP
jgi:hypothetical protein